MPTLIITRHGQSQWNLDNRFTGWVDVELTAKGIEEAERGGRLIAEAGISVDHAYTSVLTRAIRTCELNLWRAGQSFVPVTKDWRLNERHYGALTGLDKAETAARHGDAQVLVWRRSYDIPPPPLEALKTTLERVLPYWTAEIAPRLAKGQTVLVAAHGNSLRAIVKHLFNVPDDKITGVEIPTANPLVIDLAEGGAKVLGARYLDATRANALPSIG
eukprot:gene16530-16709_t